MTSGDVALCCAAQSTPQPESVLATYSDTTKAVLDLALDRLKTSLAPESIAALRRLVELGRLEDLTLARQALDSPADMLKALEDANR